jgi:hypothetical protein
MNPRLQIDHLADMAREHQAEMRRIALTEPRRRATGPRWQVGLVMLAALALPVALLFVRGW